MSDIKECLSDLATQPLLYTDTIHGDQVMRDDLWVVSTDELNENQAEITRLTAIIKENEADKWISVEDRFPERIEGNKILCFSNDYIFECVYEDDNWCNIFGETFTHWQPLLQPPAMRVKGE